MSAIASTGLPVPYRPWSAASLPAHDLYHVSHDDLRTLRAFVRALFETPRRRDRAEGLQRRPARPPLAYRPVAPAGRRTFDSCLADLTDAVEEWFDEGVQLAPVLGERVQLFLQRSGRLAWERAFLAVYLYHFAGCHVGPHAGLMHRARELRAYPAQRRADQASIAVVDRHHGRQDRPPPAGRMR